MTLAQNSGYRYQKKLNMSTDNDENTSNFIYHDVYSRYIGTIFFSLKQWFPMDWHSFPWMEAWHAVCNDETIERS